MHLTVGRRKEQNNYIDIKKGIERSKKRSQMCDAD
jgi:hypothetical protein